MITNLQIGSAGRLGNQMFQLAALVGVWKKTRYPIQIPTENTKLGFGNAADLTTGGRIIYACELLDAFGPPTINSGPDITKLFTPRDEINPEYEYTERSFEFHPDVFGSPDNTTFKGYFQSEKYFIHAEQTVRNLFRFRDEIREEARRNLELVENDAPRVAIHVRRSDYIGNSQNHVVQELEYYQDAITKFFSHEPYRFVVFTDDPEWCETAFEGGHIVKTGNSHVDLCMMSMCDHNIIANSSFSWWGAWLNANPKKLVVAPSQWFGPNLRHHNTVDLIPDSWYII